jgi:ATP-dependent Lon protease
MLKNTDLFEALPPQFHDSAFIDRLHAYLPGWEVDIIRGEMFTSGYGFIVDYLAEILRHLRAEDFSHRPDRYFTVPVQTHIRDRAAISKTMSGLLKLIFPNGGETEAEVEELLRFAIECRKRVKDQLLRIDSTFESADFHYIASDGAKRAVTTLEEEEFPQFYHRRSASDVDDSVDQYEVTPVPAQSSSTLNASEAPAVAVTPTFVPKPGHVVYTENRKGISFDKIFGPWTDGATRIIITDPYIRKFHQARNVMELIEMLIRRKQPEDQIAVHLVTAPDDGNIQEQRECLDGIAEACTGTGVDFTWAFDGSGTLHARNITTDTGWKMVLDRGLDIFQPTPRKMNGFSLGERMQEHRMIRGFYVTYVENL